MHSRRAGGQFPQPVPHISHFREFYAYGFAHLHYIVGVQFLQLFLPVFAVFLPILHHFPHFWPPGPTPCTEPAAGTQKQGAGRPRGAATPHQAACGRRRTARAPRPGAPPPRAPGGAAPTGGTRPRRRATAGRPARQERAEGERVHRGGYRRAGPEGPTTPNPRRPGPAARGAARRRSGAGGQRPGGPQADRPRKRAGPGTGHDRPHTAIAVGPALRGAEASRWVPPRPERSGGSGGRVPGGGPPAQTPQAAQRRPRVGRRWG